MYVVADLANGQSFLRTKTVASAYYIYENALIYEYVQYTLLFTPRLKMFRAVKDMSEPMGSDHSCSQRPIGRALTFRNGIFL